MRKENLPICRENDSIKSIIYKITDGKCGLVAVEEENNIRGVISDGDIRRAMETKEEDFFKLKAKDIMSLNPKTINQYEKLTVANELMSINKINSLLVLDEAKKLVGIIQLYDLGI
jgi:arabinose-5-phosphate isomerase